VLRRRGSNSAALPASAAPQEKRIPGVRVLVVDDSEINREVAMRILMFDGAVVTLANDGKAALDWLRNNPDAVDIVLMDVQMPVMDGYEATRQLRALPAIAHLPVIALTAGAFKAQQDAAKAAGMDAFVAKPFNVDELMAAIQALTHCQPESSLESDTVKSTSTKKPAELASAIPTEAQSAHEETTEGIKNLPGIAVTQGLSLWKDLAVYRKFLLKFATDYADCNSKLTDYYAAKNHEATHALLHKLKGAAGTLALTDIARLAAELEATEAASDSSELLTQLQVAFDTTIASISLFTATAQTEPISPVVTDIKKATPLLHELILALDTDTPDHANQLLNSLAAVLPQTALAPIQNCIDSFDFRGAEVLVHQLAHQLGITLEE